MLKNRKITPQNYGRLQVLRFNEDLIPSLRKTQSVTTQNQIKEHVILRFTGRNEIKTYSQRLEPVRSPVDVPLTIEKHPN